MKVGIGSRKREYVLNLVEYVSLRTVSWKAVHMIQGMLWKLPHKPQTFKTKNREIIRCKIRLLRRHLGEECAGKLGWHGVYSSRPSQLRSTFTATAIQLSESVIDASACLDVE